MQNINFKDFIIEEYDKASTNWINTINVSNDIDDLKNYVRLGNSITCADDTGIFLHENELADCYFYIVVDGGTDLVRKIKSNTAGKLSNTSQNTKQAVIVLYDADPTDPTTTTGYIVSNKCSVIVHQNGQRSAGFRLKITAQETNENYYKIGTMIYGPLHVSQQYSRGKTTTYTAGTQIEETNDATLRTKSTNAGYRNLRIA